MLPPFFGVEGGGALRLESPAAAAAGPHHVTYSRLLAPAVLATTVPRTTKSRPAWQLPPRVHGTPGAPPPARTGEPARCETGPLPPTPTPSSSS